MHASCDLPDNHCVFRVFPEASQAVRGVDGQWVILEFQDVRDRCRLEQAAELLVARSRQESVCDRNAIVTGI